ncbi:MAG: sigma-70 family RNA polymerase sigma factor [Gemmatimonadales bacterium]
MTTGSITASLARLRAGEADALDQLFPLIYDDLRIVARAQLTREATGHTLGPTALVHEAYVKLGEREKLLPEDRRHFFAIAAQAMRRILIDHARSRKRIKRGAGQIAVPLEEIESLMTDDAADELVALDDALDRLAKANPRAALVVERRFFGGLTLEETAAGLDVSLKTVQRDWLLARAWLRKEIDRELPSLRTLDSDGGQ